MDDVQLVTNEKGGVAKATVLLGGGSLVLLVSASMWIGRLQSQTESNRDELRAIRVELQSRESKDAVALMFGDLRARLSRIESLLDRSTGTTSTQRMP